MIKQYQTLEEGLIIVAFIVLIVLACFCGGCAGATPQYDSQGNIIGVTGYGFLRDLEIEQVKPDGSKFSLKSKSTSADVLRAGNEVLGTVVNAASKATP